jgi:hypothetical protein
MSGNHDAHCLSTISYPKYDRYARDHSMMISDKSKFDEKWLALQSMTSVGHPDQRG